MDELQFVCKWSNSSQTRKHLSCRLTGLILEGCTFDGMKLAENSTDSAPRTKSPDCTISWIPCTVSFSVLFKCQPASYFWFAYERL